MDDTLNVRFSEQVKFFLLKNNYILQEIISYPNNGKSFFYKCNDTVVILDNNICSSEDKEIFPYSLITNIQNKYMKSNKKVWRFLEDDFESIHFFLDNTNEISPSMSFNQNKIVNRENSADASPLEYYFEERFKDVYGADSIKFLHKEYPINDYDGSSFFIDYIIQTTDNTYGIEENGISYHHPQIIGVNKYRRQLKKQNICTSWGIKLFRFSTEDCKQKERLNDSIRSYFGKDSYNFKENGLLIDRKIKLYEHQELTLQNIQKERDNGIKTFLVVFPTASGKSKIIEEDIKSFAAEIKNFKALILAPNTNIILDWQERIKINIPELENKITCTTFSSIIRHYTEYDKKYFSYIVIDEAHHAVAPVLKRVIQYYTPDFLIGLTATDQRPDKKKLESIFGSYKSTLSLEDAMNKNIIATANVYRIETNLNLSEIRINGKDFLNSDLEKNIRITSRNNLIAQVIKEYFSNAEQKYFQGIIFCVNTEHTKEMEKVFLAHNISAKAYSSKEKNPQKIMSDFKNKKIRFLCSCSMINEGWDYPEIRILIMARPTLSRVLYLQQIGRGLRKTEIKKNVFIIDVVDEYGPMSNPCSMHSIFQNPYYVPFGDITKRNYKKGDFITIDGISERIEKISEVNINDFSQKYEDYLSVEQVAQDYFIGTETLNNWIKTKKVIPSVSFPFGSKKIHMFNKEDVEYYREKLKIKKHDDTTILKDFFDFLAQRDYTFSYKMIFLLSFLKNMNTIGEVKIDNLLKDYTSFYIDRIEHKLRIEKKNCPFTLEYLLNDKKMKENMLSNPFEKFERKRFFYFTKDLNIISMNLSLFEKLKKNDIVKIIKQMLEDLEKYYSQLDGLYKESNLIKFAEDCSFEYEYNDTSLLLAADSGNKDNY